MCYPIFYHVALSPPIRSVIRGIPHIGDEGFILPENSRRDVAWRLVVQDGPAGIDQSEVVFYFLRLGLSHRQFPINN